MIDIHIKTKLYEIMIDNAHNILNDGELKDQLIQYICFKNKEDYLFGELLILHYSMYQDVYNDDIYQVAAAIELLILSLDILDDIEDQDNYNVPWVSNQNLSINIATCLIFLCNKIIFKTSLTHKEKALKLLNDYCISSTEGQHIDLLNNILTEKEYIHMITLKSGSLAELSCLIGTVLANPDKKDAVMKYAKYLGIIGQIKNDMDGIVNREKNDLLLRKKTLPIIYLLSTNVRFENREKLNNYYQVKKRNLELSISNNEIRKMLEESGANLYIEVIQQLYRNRTESIIKTLIINERFKQYLLKYL